AGPGEARRDGDRGRALARGPRVRVGRAAQGKHEPAVVPRPGGVRARALHARDHRLRRLLTLAGGSAPASRATSSAALERRVPTAGRASLEPPLPALSSAPAERDGRPSP